MSWINFIQDSPALSRGYATWRCGAFSLLGVFVALFGSGCAVRYHDIKTGTEHIWGFTHVKMRVASADGEAPSSAAIQTQTLGLGINAGSDALGSSIVLGWDSRTRIFVPDGTALSLEWPGTDLFDVRIGHNPPFLPTVIPPPAIAP